jgi:alanine racemase
MGGDPYALIDLSALRHNLRRAREAAPNSKVMAVIKADGYGHGILRAATALADADALAVARIDEGIVLRQAGEQRPIVILEGFCEQQGLLDSAANALEPVIHQSGQIEILEQKQLPQPISCWMKVDTGMHRLGLPTELAADSFQRLVDCKSVAGKPRLISHLANADNPADPTTDRQIELFTKMQQQFEVEASLANSGGILGWSGSHMEWVRPGIMLYGSSPFDGRTGDDDGLMPVMTLKSSLIAVNQCRQGDAIGYGGTWVCPEDMSVGVIAIGYGDGYPRHAPSGTPVLLNDRRVPLIGRVSMDMITVDLRTQPQAKVGDEAILWGRGLPADEIAVSAGTIAYQLFCGVTARVGFVESEG